MAHYAELDENNIVLRVVVVNNDCEQDPDGNDDEIKGVAFCQSLFGENTRWVRTSYHGNIRANYAGVGYEYREDIDAFIAPQPYPSWSLDEKFQWQAPIAYPADGAAYSWDEENQAWAQTDPRVN